jgi:hypothetical protein
MASRFWFLFNNGSEGRTGSVLPFRIPYNIRGRGSVHDEPLSELSLPKERKDPTMRPDRTFFLIPFFLFLLSCSGNDAEGERIEKEAERSAEKAADRSFDKLNQGGSDSAKTDSSAD